MTLTFWVAVDPATETLRGIGFGVATRPIELPVVSVTWKLTCPNDVPPENALTVTLAVSLTPEKNCGFADTVTVPGVPELNSVSQF